MAGFLSIGKGYDPDYLTKAVGQGAEDYYLSAIREHGEPPGYWSGRGAAELGLTEGSEVDPEVMEALYSQFWDVRDKSVLDPKIADAEKPRLGRKPARYATPDEIFAAKITAEPEATEERREQLMTEARKEARKALQFADLTFSPTKSVTLLHAGLRVQAKLAREAGDAEQAAIADRGADVVEEVVKEAAAAGVDESNRLAGWTRVGYHGSDVNGATTGRYMKAGGWVVASFLQHTARGVGGRDGDPQLHVHQAVLNRQLSEDGAWRSLYGRALLRTRAQASAVAERTLMERLTSRLGVQWIQRADGQGWEIEGVEPSQIEAFSSRRAQVSDRVAALVAAYERKHGYAPNALATFKIAQFATKDTKKAKSAHAPSPDEELDAWEAQTTRSEVDSLASIPARALGRLSPEVARARGAEELARTDLDQVVEAALADAQAQKSTFTRYELARHLSRYLPSSLGGLSAAQVSRLLDDLTEQALNPEDPQKRRTLNTTVADVVDLPESLRDADGRSVFRDPTAEWWTTREQLTAEDAFLRSAVQTDAPAAEAAAAAGLLGFGPVAERTGTEPGVDGTELVADTAVQPGSVSGLGADQAAAIYGVLTSGRRVDVLEGVAGAGKSYTMTRLAELWQRSTEGRVVGLATSQSAANVLKGEGMGRAFNIDRWLRRMRLRRENLRPGDLVVVDEASMVTTHHLSRIQRIAEKAGAKVLLTGDSQQLAAPGAGGMMRLLAQRHGSYQLTEVRRFEEPWEAEASKRLRVGDVDVLAEYDRRGRIRGGTREQMRQGAVEAHVAGYVQGLETMIVASTNQEAAELAGMVRERLVQLGIVGEQPLAQLADGNSLSYGDRIAARHNEARVRIGRGGQRELSNRDVFRVTGVHTDGRLHGVLLDEQGNAGESVLLDQEYVRTHVELAYAGTSHAVQGATLDECHPVVSEGMSRQELYVMLSRARSGGTAWVDTEIVSADLRPETPEPAADQTGSTAVHESTTADAHRPQSERTADDAELRDPIGVLAQILETDQADETATERLAMEADRVSHMGHLGAMWTSLVKDDLADQTSQILAQILPEETHQSLQADPARGAVMTAARRAALAGHNLRDTLDKAAEGGWDKARSIGQVLESRIEKIIGTGEAYADSWARLTPRGLDKYSSVVADIATHMDQRVTDLGERAATEPPAYLVERIGEPPIEIMARTEWVQRAGHVEAYREFYGNPDSPVALPPAPERHSPEQRAAWMAASAALGQTVSERQITGAGDGQLWAWRAEYERAARWAPPHLGAELSAAHREIIDRRQESVIGRAEAEQAERTGRSEDGARLRTRAEAAQTLAEAAEMRRDRLAEVQAQREAWHEHTEHLRTRAMAADAELHRRHDDLDLPALHQRIEESAPADSPEAAGFVERVRGQAELFGRSVRQWVRDGIVDRKTPEPEPEAEPAHAQEELDLGLAPAPAPRARAVEREAAQLTPESVHPAQGSLFGTEELAASTDEAPSVLSEDEERVRREREELWARAEHAEPEAEQPELDLGLVPEPTQEEWLDRALESAQQARAILQRRSAQHTVESIEDERRLEEDRYRDHLARREEQELEQRRQEQERAQAEQRLREAERAQPEPEHAPVIDYGGLEL